MNRHKLALIVAAGAVLLTANTQAGPIPVGGLITITDTAPDDSVSITFSPDEFGRITGAGTFAESAGALPFSGDFVSPLVGTDTVSLYLTEANEPLVVSDILNLTIVGTDGVATVTGTFRSDFENNLGPLPVNVTVEFETGPITVNDTDSGLQVLINSDAEVPEPASLGMLVIGAAGLAGCRCRRRTQAA